MKRPVFSVVIVSVFATAVAVLSAQQRATPTRTNVSPPAPTPTAARPAGRAVASASTSVADSAPSIFENFCFECHANYKPAAGLSLETLLAQPNVGNHYQQWEKVAEMLETGLMPPADASAYPSSAEQQAAARWVRGTLKSYALAHAGEPGRVTVRRLTSGEYAYAIHDLTGIDIPVGVDASSDSVGGEGFTNFGDVQFVEDASIERYLDAAKTVADHAVIGAGPLEFYGDTGKTGLELSALNRINTLYEAKGFRVVSGEGGRPFGLERYGKAFFVTWYYRHRVALGDPSATLRTLAAKEGITGRFAEHMWSVMNLPSPGYPTKDTIDGWKQLPAPTTDAAASIAKARTATDALYKTLTTWPSWFFARGDLAAGGAGDESPLMFNDESLKAEATRHYTYALGPRPARGRGAPTPSGPTKVFITFHSLNPTTGVKPVVIWRNARVVTRAAVAPPARGAAPPPPGTVVGRGNTVLSTVPLRTFLSERDASALNFGMSPDGSRMGPDDFATSDTVSLDIPPPATGTTAELQVDAELGLDRNAVVRLMITDRAEGSFRDALQRMIMADTKSVGYKTFRAGMAEYASLLPPNSHGEANPADKDPVPPPFDNTYNSPEHDAFVLKVKYQRTDDFFTANLVDGADRKRLNEAWNDLFGSWPYHDAYLGMLADHYHLTLTSRHIADMTPAVIAQLPSTAVQPYVTELRAHYDRVVRAQVLAEPGHVADALAFASRAWRRPLTVAETASLRAFYQKSRTALHLDHDGAMRTLIARVLVSPAFLYRVETVASAPVKTLNSWELASRLSFFLWSSVPDDELRRAAAAGELTNPAMLAKQVSRMTADPKARRIATEFFGQWLGFYHFDQYRGVDTGRFPEFTEDVKKAMYDEAVSTFEYIVRQRRPVREMLYADYTFLNKPLAAFYGLDAKLAPGDAVVRVDGANTFNRGGALRLGSVLTTTSAPLRTSPVKRGDWVLRRILGTPTPPPPADAGSIPADEKAFNGLTLRERLAQHKRNATCANCHLRIDPLGFPLEGFDAIGRTRTTYSDGKAVDATGEFADKTTISGTDGLLTYLQHKDAQVMKTLSKKLIGYALGRTVQVSDQLLLEDMIAAGGTSTFSDLATRIVTSKQFRTREGTTAAPVAPAAVPKAATVTSLNRPTPERAGTR